VTTLHHTPPLKDLRRFKRTFQSGKPPSARLNLDWIGGGNFSRWGEKKWRVSVGRSATRGWHRHLADGVFGLLRSPDTRSGAPRKDKRATGRVRCGGGGGYDTPARWMLAATRAMRPDRQFLESWAKPILPPSSVIAGLARPEEAFRRSKSAATKTRHTSQVTRHFFSSPRLACAADRA
jgi:hypothetical protein